MEELFANKDWFHSIGKDQYGRLVVYIKYTTSETLNDIPDTFDGKQVMVHFASSLTASKEKFTEVLSTRKGLEPIQNLTEEEPAVDLELLISELARLALSCSTNIVEDIFYEVHDRAAAITNLSASYPEVRKSLDSLYDQYGFDLIYDELQK